MAVWQLESYIFEVKTSLSKIVLIVERFICFSSLKYCISVTFGRGKKFNSVVKVDSVILPFLSEWFQPLSSYHLLHVFKLRGVSFPGLSDHLFD